MTVENQTTDSQGGPEKEDFSDDTSTFGDRITWAREQVGLTQEQLAHRMGVKTKTLRGWEEDQAEPRASRINIMAGMMNVSVVWLLSGLGEGPVAPRGEGAIADCLEELRLIREEQRKFSDQVVRLEERLRAALETV